MIRRLSFDLLGLPPTPEETQAFEKDPSPQAYEHLVDRLLSSPHYGERWARHWLDIAHYADTHGFERDKLRDNAWRYRDYVISALTNDKPYDRCLREHIAGDVMPTVSEETTVATGFLAAGPWDFVGQVETRSPTLKRAARADDLDDMVTQVMTAACGVTINCARCHDHKLDPISQKEYYSLWAVFAGVRRGDRALETEASRKSDAERARINAELGAVTKKLFEMGEGGLDLADIIGGGDGTGTGVKDQGIDPRNGQIAKEKGGFLTDVKPNTFVAIKEPFINGVFIPGGGEVTVSSTGLKAQGVSKTSGQAWDAIRNGPVNSQKSTEINGLDYNSKGHSLLGLHANAGITFDLEPVRKVIGQKSAAFSAVVGYGGRPGGKAKNQASVRVFVDGVEAFARDRLGPADSAVINVVLPVTARFLTLMSTDGGDGIGHDQVFFGDPKITVYATGGSKVAELHERRAALLKQIKDQAEKPKVYAVVSEKPEAVTVLRRGDPEQPGETVNPGVIHCIEGLQAALGADSTSEGDRRLHLAEWITSSANPLTRRVIMNRLWHHHFGNGIVDTPSDFGLGGGRPSHPALLDWLADELLKNGWSLKHMHKLMVMSATYRQSSAANEAAMAVDGGNRLLWRMNPRRLEAESMRDAVLSVTGCLNPTMGGPGYKDFKYTEAYAPIYEYVPADSPDLWRRSIYRFVVRSTVQPMMTTLDCPNPANLTPARMVTTTALQSLVLMNNEFMIRQAKHFAERIQKEAGAQSEAQVRRAFGLAFARQPSEGELHAALAFVARDGLLALCRTLFNANEFAYVE